MLRAEDLDPTIHKLPQSSAEALIYIHSSMPCACILPRPMMKHPFRTQALRGPSNRMGPILGPGRMVKSPHGELDLDLTKSPRMDDSMRFLPRFSPSWCRWIHIHLKSQSPKVSAGCLSSREHESIPLMIFLQNYGEWMSLGKVHQPHIDLKIP